MPIKFVIFICLIAENVTNLYKNKKTLAQSTQKFYWLFILRLNFGLINFYISLLKKKFIYKYE